METRARLGKPLTLVTEPSRWPFGYGEPSLILGVREGAVMHREHAAFVDAARIAVVIPAFRAADTLPECLDSVLAQTEPRLEVVVVDDGSTDDTFVIAARMARTDPRVRTVRQQNRGPGAARNHGASLTTAPYIAFFDADDLMPPDKLATQARFLDDHPGIDVTYSAMEEFDEEGDRRRTLGRRVEPKAPLHETLLTGGMPCLPSATLQRRSAYETVGGFRSGWRVTEDWDYYLRMAVSGSRFAHLPDPAVLYRRHEEQRSSDVRGYFADCQRMMESIHRVYRESRRPVPEQVRLRAHWITLMQAALLDLDGQRPRARRLVLRSLLFGGRPGNLCELLPLLRRPAVAFHWAGLEPPEPRSGATRDGQRRATPA